MPKQYQKKNFFTAVAVFVAGSFMMVASIVAQDFTQGYATDETLIRGSIVGLNSEDSNKVEGISSDRENETLGVVIRNNESAVTLTDDRSGVFVATTGRFEVLVSDVNGTIKSGDYLATSSINGIGAKVNSTQEIVIGKALQNIDFSSPTQVLSRTQATNDEGELVDVRIGRVLAEINVDRNPTLAAGQRVPGFLLNFSETVAGKPVTPIKIYAGVAILLVASTISGSLVYSAVKSSITAIGRNPLSKRSVLSGLFQVGFVSAMIFISGLVAVYLILKI